VSTLCFILHDAVRGSRGRIHCHQFTIFIIRWLTTVCSFISSRVTPYLLRWQSRRYQAEANTLRAVEHDHEEYELARMQTSLRNMIANMTRMIEITRPEGTGTITRTDRREYISNALLRKVSGASVTTEEASG
jgi:hypothetical protein